MAFAANLLHTIAVPVEVPDRTSCFEVRGTYKTFVLQAPSDANMRLWITGIENAAISKYQPDAKVRKKNDVSRLFLVQMLHTFFFVFGNFFCFFLFSCFFRFLPSIFP